MKIELVDARAPRPVVQTLNLPEGARVRDALAIRGWSVKEARAGEWGLGVFGEQVSVDTVLQAGDRLEVCPPLEMSPQEARRRRAAAEKARTQARGQR